VFDRETRARARQTWRLLYVDGHGSHVTLGFLEYCAANRILVACFPPHATHTVQPLDVVVFKSLSAAYSRELEDFRIQSRGILPMAKRDFFSLFWRAWESTLSPDPIKKSFEVTGLVPLNPATPHMLGQRWQKLSLPHYNTGSCFPEGHGRCMRTRALHLRQLKDLHPPGLQTPCTYWHLEQS
jgi:hypothetical protein